MGGVLDTPSPVECSVAISHCVTSDCASCSRLPRASATGLFDSELYDHPRSTTTVIRHGMRRWSKRPELCGAFAGTELKLPAS